MIKPTLTYDQNVFSLNSYGLISLARASAVANLANSAGCIPNDPSGIHDFEALTTLPNTRVERSKRITSP